MFQGAFSDSIIKRAWKGIISIDIRNIRDYCDADDRHKTVDDYPYGGDAGMLETGTSCRRGDARRETVNGTRL